MTGARTTCLVFAALLLLATAVAAAGCGDQASAQENQVLSGLEPFVGQAALIASQDPTETVVGEVTQYRDGKLHPASRGLRSQAQRDRGGSLQRRRADRRKRHPMGFQCHHQ